MARLLKSVGVLQTADDGIAEVPSVDLGHQAADLGGAARGGHDPVAAVTVTVDHGQSGVQSLLLDPDRVTVRPQSDPLLHNLKRQPGDTSWVV